jgi:ferrous iron transport protein A
MADVSEPPGIGADGVAPPSAERARADRGSATLAGLAVGGRGAIRTFACAAPLMQRLLEMGLTRGTEVEVIRVAPLGDPIEIRLRGYFLSLRKAEAALIRIDEVPRS